MYAAKNKKNEHVTWNTVETVAATCSHPHLCETCPPLYADLMWTWEIPVSFEVGEVDLDGSGICVANAGLT